MCDTPILANTGSNLTRTAKLNAPKCSKQLAEIAPKEQLDNLRSFDDLVTTPSVVGTGPSRQDTENRFCFYSWSLRQALPAEPRRSVSLGEIAGECKGDEATGSRPRTWPLSPGSVRVAGGALLAWGGAVLVSGGTVLAAGGAVRVSGSGVLVSGKTRLVSGAGDRVSGEIVLFSGALVSGATAFLSGRTVRGCG